MEGQAGSSNPNLPLPEASKKSGEKFSIEAILLAKGNRESASSQDFSEEASKFQGESHAVAASVFQSATPTGSSAPPPTSQALKARMGKSSSGHASRERDLLVKDTPLSHAHPSAGGNKRARTIFTSDQLEKMEREFHKQQYVVGHERMYLANALNLTEAQVKVWFQNRRIKWRKQHMLSEQTRLHTLTDSNFKQENTADPRAQLDQLN